MADADDGGGDVDRDPQQSPDTSLPALAALFLIKFDVKVGYTIAWRRSLDDVPLDGVVEFKSLPSGLHNVKEDLVYFVHESFAGLSAFANGAAGEEERNARFVAVGVLVPRHDGRLGRAWLHAAALKGLARQLVADSKETRPLEEFWHDHRIRDEANGRVPGSGGSPFTAAQRRARTLSTATRISPAEQTLPPYHPAFSIFELLDTFGPLVFPVHREALLRRRLLLITRPPVHISCDFVYDLSILSSLPLTLAPIITIPSPSSSRIRPLFALGIHDIPYLENLQSPSAPKPSNGQPVEPGPESPGDSASDGWIACTTDEILAVKSHLYDVLIELPSVQGVRWPTLRRADNGKQIKATQRDLRRYRALRRALNPIRRLIHQGGDTEERYEDQETDEHAHLLFKQANIPDDAEEDDDWSNGDEDKLTEPTTWSALAYSSFMWWARAGEKDEWEREEEELDESLLSDMGVLAAKVADQFRYRDGPSDAQAEAGDRPSTEQSAREQRENNALLETAVIAYFHRVTKQLFEACAGVIEEQVGEGSPESDDNEDDYVKISSTDLRRMGLDVWSQGDSEFVVHFLDLWFQRRVEVRSLEVECCGVRIC